jgi:hypothetical protein
MKNTDHIKREDDLVKNNQKSFYSRKSGIRNAINRRLKVRFEAVSQAIKKTQWFLSRNFTPVLVRIFRYNKADDINSHDSIFSSCVLGIREGRVKNTF